MKTTKLLAVAPAVLLLLSMFLLAFKAYQLIPEKNYMAYGLDSLRLLGQGQHVRYFGYLDPNSSHRYVLPYIIAFTAWIFDPLPSQTLIIPFLLINLGCGLTLYYFAYQLGKDHTKASLSVFLLATLLLRLPAQINSSGFFSLILLPLRFGVLWRLLTGSNARSLRLNSLLYATLSVLSYFTYPILALLTDLFVYSFLVLVSFQTSKYHHRFLPVVAAHIIAPLLYFVYVQSRFGFHQSLDQFFTRTFSSFSVSGLTSWLPIFYLVFFLLQLLLLHPRFLSLLTRSRPRLFLLFSSNIYRFTGYLIFCLSLGLLLNWHLSVLFPQLYPLPKDFLTYLPRLALALLFFSLIWLNHRSFSSHPKLLALSLPIVAYFGFFILPLPILKNERFVFFFQVMALAIIPQIIRLPNYFHRYLFATILLLVANTNLALIPHRYPASGNHPVLAAIDWLSHQPEKNNNLFYANYLRQEHIVDFEQARGAYLLPPRIPFSVRAQLKECRLPGTTCFQQFLDFAQQRNIRYIILEQWSHPQIPSLAQQAGRLIYQQQRVLIYQLL